MFRSYGLTCLQSLARHLHSTARYKSHPNSQVNVCTQPCTYVFARISLKHAAGETKVLWERLTLFSYPTTSMITLPRGSLSASMSRNTTGFFVGPEENSLAAATPSELYFMRFWICDIAAAARPTRLRRSGGGEELQAAGARHDVTPPHLRWQRRHVAGFHLHVSDQFCINFEVRGKRDDFLFCYL